MPRPDASEYADYFGQYISIVPDTGDICDRLATQIEESAGTLDSLTDAQWDHRYAEGRWSAKEVVGHVVDTERIMATRGLVAARGETQEYPGFDQDVFMAHTDFGARTAGSVLEEWRTLRASNLALFRSFSDTELDRAGLFEGKRMTVRSFPWLLAGHELHHMRVLRERYLT